MKFFSIVFLMSSFAAQATTVKTVPATEVTIKVEQVYYKTQSHPSSTRIGATVWTPYKTFHSDSFTVKQGYDYNSTKDWLPELKFLMPWGTEISLERDVSLENLPGAKFRIGTITFAENKKKSPNYIDFNWVVEASQKGDGYRHAVINEDFSIHLLIQSDGKFNQPYTYNHDEIDLADYIQ